MMDWPQNLCRICGEINANCCNIYEEISQIRGVYEKIRKCLKLQLYENDNKPQRICDCCLTKLDDFDGFITTCHAANERFESILSLKQQQQENGAVNRNETDTKITVNIDLIENNDNLTIPTITKTELIDFSKTVTHFMAQPISEPQPEQQEKKSFKCTHCEKVFKRRLNLTAHIRTFHSKIRPYKCDKCNKTYAIRSDLTNHRKIHTEHFKCKYCSSCFIAPSKLERHIRTHTNYRPFKCDYQNCMKSFSDKRNLDDHKVTHTNLFNFTCSICWKAFKTKNVLRQHERTHKRLEKFECHICTNVYSHKQNLQLHLKKHNGYICQYCQLDCQRLGVFLKHKRTCTEKCKIIDVVETKQD